MIAAALTVAGAAATALAEHHQEAAPRGRVRRGLVGQWLFGGRLDDVGHAQTHLAQRPEQGLERTGREIAPGIGVREGEHQATAGPQQPDQAAQARDLLVGGLQHEQGGDRVERPGRQAAGGGEIPDEELGLRIQARLGCPARGRAHPIGGGVHAHHQRAALREHAHQRSRSAGDVEHAAALQPAEQPQHGGMQHPGVLVPLARALANPRRDRAPAVRVLRHVSTSPRARERPSAARL